MSGGDSSSLNEIDEWEEQNQTFDRIIEDVVMKIPTMLQPTNHNARARRRHIERIREDGHEQLFKMYFSVCPEPIYHEDIFRRRFRMRKHVFERIMEALSSDEYFQQKRDATGRLGMSLIQKCTAAIRVLAYGTPPDLHDECLRMSEQVIRTSVMKFAEGVISNFGKEYLRRPTEEDMARLLHIGEQRGFPGMMGSIDCMHWEWKNCPTAWAGQYQGRSGTPTIILEAVASEDLWIWHAFFGSPGTNNDINVLDKSPVFDDILAGRAPKVSYTVNGRERDMGYYLTDGIYPKWAAFVKSIKSPIIRKHKLFAQYQESVRKDVERAFGVLQARFAFIKHPCFLWDRHAMGTIMNACIILHNMIVEDERDTYLNYTDPKEFMKDRTTQVNQEEHEEDYVDPIFNFSTERVASLARYMTTREQLRNRQGHNELMNDLIEHIWDNFNEDD